MDVAEFDQFADEYHNLHQENIRITGEKPEYFAEYKICHLKRVAKIVGVDVNNILDFGTGVGNNFPFFIRKSFRIFYYIYIINRVWNDREIFVKITKFFF